jgi:hypothetical protein
MQDKALILCTCAHRCIIFPKSDPKSRTYYMGEFDEGLMHGVGVLYFQQHGLRYEGQFQQDKVDCLKISHCALG